MIAATLAVLFFLALVFSTHVLGSRYATRVGIVAAVLVAAHHLAGLTAVPAWQMAPSAGWIASVAAATGTKRGATLLGGVLAGAAIWLLPALSPLALVVAIFLLLRPERSWSVRMRWALEYALPCVVAFVLAELIPLSLALVPQQLGSGGIGAVSAGLAPIFVELLLMLVPLLLLPGALTRLLVALIFVASVVDLATPAADSPIWFFVNPQEPLGAVLLIASIDAAWHRARFAVRRSA